MYLDLDLGNRRTGYLSVTCLMLQTTAPTSVFSVSVQCYQYAGCYPTTAGVWSPGKVDVDDCGRQFVPFVAQQQQQLRPPNSAYVDVTTAGVRYGVAAPYEHAVRCNLQPPPVITSEFNQSINQSINR